MLSGGIFTDKVEGDVSSLECSKILRIGTKFALMTLVRNLILQMSRDRETLGFQAETGIVVWKKKKNSNIILSSISFIQKSWSVQKPDKKIEMSMPKYRTYIFVLLRRLSKATFIDSTVVSGEYRTHLNFLSNIESV